MAVRPNQLPNTNRIPELHGLRGIAILMVMSFHYINNQLTWIGTISYSLYLFHYFLLDVVDHMFGSRNGIGIYKVSDILITFVALLLTFLFSWLIY